MQHNVIKDSSRSLPRDNPVLD